MKARTIICLAIPFVGLLASVGCTASEDAADETTTTVDTASFCVTFPTRDAGSSLTIPESPDLEGDEETIRGLLGIAATGYEASAPREIEAQVKTLAATLRGWEPNAEGLGDDPATKEAVADIDEWLQANCPTPPATTPR